MYFMYKKIKNNALSMLKAFPERIVFIIYDFGNIFRNKREEGLGNIAHN